MPEAVHVGSGKVRELFALDDDRLLLVASDRISTFDVVLPTEIPDKGRVLTGLSAFWFARTRELCPNHLLGLILEARLATLAGDTTQLHSYERRLIAAQKTELAKERDEYVRHQDDITNALSQARKSLAIKS